MLHHLGEALVPNADQAIVELVKNAFDADATKCDVRIDQADGATLTIKVSDNGVGMSAEDMRDRWLLLGTSTKSRNARTKRFNRVQVGDKGLGRLAALRLGSKASVVSKRDKSAAARVDIDWSAYQNVRSVDEVVLEVNTSTRPTRGTSISVSGIAPMPDSQLQRMARSLALLSDPFARDSTFRVSLSGTRITPNIRRDFDNRFFRFARYRIRATFDGAGELRMALYQGTKAVDRNVMIRNDQTVPFTFELWDFSKPATLSIQAVPKREIREWIRTFGGVHLFDGPVRIAPAGDRPVDWLDMNLLRVRNPELRPSTNNSIGRVVLDNSSGLIMQTTDRVSFVDNKAYAALRVACQDVLEWAARSRVSRREEDRQAERARPPQTLQVQTTALEQMRSVLTREQLADIEPAVSLAFAEADREVKTLRQDIVLYRAMATAGITATVFAHELGQSLGILRRRLPEITDAIKKAQLDVATALDLVQRAVRRLTAYIDLPGRFATSVRRKSPTINVNKILTEAVEPFRAILQEDDINLKLDVSTADIYVRSSKAMFEAVIANLITNSVQAFRRGVGTSRDKQILVKTRVSGKTVVIELEDNAGGIRDIKLKDIWLPGATTTPGGTGFGLTIVRDTITDMAGRIDVNPRTRFGGALFTMSLPRL